MWDLLLEKARVTDFRSRWRRVKVVIHSWAHMSWWQIFKRYLWNFYFWSARTLLVICIILLIWIKQSIWGLLYYLIMVISSLWLLYHRLDVLSYNVLVWLLLTGVITSVVCWAVILRVCKPLNLHCIHTLEISDWGLFWGLLTILLNYFLCNRS